MSLLLQLFIVIIAISGAAVGLFILIGRFFNKRNLPRGSADVALVFGTGVEWKARTRWDTAARLYREGMAMNLIVSGGVRVKGEEATEAEWFRENLIALGIPPERILIENRAGNTAENTDFALPLLKKHGFKSVILVMSDFEGIRAHLTAKRSWIEEEIEIYNYHADSMGRWSAWGWWLKRSGWQLTWYTLPRLFRYRLWKYL